MPSNRDMDRLSDLALLARQAGWPEFASYCDLSGSGLRKPALVALTAFLDDAATWDFERRQAFSIWACEHSRRLEWSQVLLRRPLYQGLIMPTLREWTDRMPSDPTPHLWRGLLHDHGGSENGARGHVERALALDPTCEPARIQLIDWLIADVDYSQHHLPDFYIGDPSADLVLLDHVDGQIALCTQSARTEGWRSEVAELRANAVKSVDLRRFT